MKNIRIYHPEDNINEKLKVGQSVQLDKSASNHLIRVLRLKNHQAFTLFNGYEGEFIAELEITGKKATAHIQAFIDTYNESPLHIHLLQGISKGERMDFTIQKSIELGVTEITPVITERTVVNLKGERLQKKLAHWKNIAISACEQSGRNILPTIHLPISFKQVINQESNNLKLLLDPISVFNFKTLQQSPNKIDLLIGPEGGLSCIEIEEAKACRFIGVQLGPRVLRTETAALASIAAAQILWGDFGLGAMP